MPNAVPRATYRLQLHAGFTLDDAAAVAPYLAGLGVSHVYVSSFLTARPGSQHGYDIIDHNAVNPELGGEPALERLSAALKAYDMGLVLDFVPNHMGVGGADNAWWLDVLEWGEDSPFARFFDIDWQPPRRELKGKLLLPFLGDHYGAVLERGELVPKFDRAEGTISVWYWQHRYPVAVRDYAGLLAPAVDESPDGDALADVVLEFRALNTGRLPVAERRRRSAELKVRLAGLAHTRPAVADAVDRALAALDVARLHELLERQHYRVSFWRVAADEINYRRFFDINDLAAIRMVEEPELFARAHRLVFELLRRGVVDGLRIDHVDGLFNPAEYCRLLQAGAGEALGVRGEQPIWLVVEKILGHLEPIRRDWPVAGTTGYDFMNVVNGLFVDPDGEAALTAGGEAFRDQVLAAKLRIMDEHMASELRVLAGRLGRIAVQHWRSRDFTLSVLYGALRAYVACLAVYRTYVTSRRVTETDQRYITQALERARGLGVADPSVFAFLGKVLDTSLAGDEPPLYSRRAVVDFAMRVQQYSGPVMAKGYEDTALYRFNRLISLNEVGGEPTVFGTAPEAFHQWCRAMARSHPHTMLATATHDSKRGEDVRVRIDVLSEMPETWRRHLEHWRGLNQDFRGDLDPNDELFLYQTMLGAWVNEPDFPERLEAATLKAVREAKRRTSWAHPNEDYEAAVAAFVRHLCGHRPFLDDFLPVQRLLADVGMVSGLAQTLLKLTCPGVPDIYQGAELWQLALVDPDNRRPVDYGLRRQMLGGLADAALPAELERWRDGAVKQELIRRVLALRARRPGLFAQGGYKPLAVRGALAGHAVAFARQDEGGAMVVVAPRLAGRLMERAGGALPLGELWRGTHVEVPRHRAGAGWRELLSGRELAVAGRRMELSELLSGFPMAVLEERTPG